MKTYTRNRRPEYKIIEDVHELCRLCLARAEEPVPIFEQADNACAAVPMRIMICVGYEITREDCLPNKICRNCHQELERYYKFRKKCEESYCKLKSHFTATKYEDKFTEVQPKKVLEENNKQLQIQKILEDAPVNVITPLVISDIDIIDKHREYVKQKILEDAPVDEIVPLVISDVDIIDKQRGYVKQKILEDAPEDEIPLVISDVDIINKQHGYVKQKILEDSPVDDIVPMVISNVDIIDKQRGYVKQKILEDSPVDEVPLVISDADIIDKQRGYVKQKILEDSPVDEIPLVISNVDIIEKQRGYVKQKILEDSPVDEIPLVISDVDIIDVHGEYSQPMTVFSSIAETVNIEENADETTEIQVIEQSNEVSPDISTFLNAILVELGILVKNEQGLVVQDQGVTSFELETGDDDQVVFELVEGDDQVEPEEASITWIMPESYEHKIEPQEIELTPKDITSKKLCARKSLASSNGGAWCPVCARTFATRSAALRHGAVHSGARPHVCPVPACGRAFAQKVVMKRHLLVHQKNRPHQCPECTKSFTQRGSLVAHARTHANNAQRALTLHACTHCDKMFLYASGLSRHMLTHSGRMYSCGACDRLFRDKSSLLRHVRTAHRDPPPAPRRVPPPLAPRVPALRVPPPLAPLRVPPPLAPRAPPRDPPRTYPKKTAATSRDATPEEPHTFHRRRNLNKT